MAQLHKPYYCAVIDEIQMIADTQRGAGWSTALLGLLTPELHLTGESSASELIQIMLNGTSDTIHKHYYERLSPLKVDKPVEEISDLKPGD